MTTLTHIDNLALAKKNETIAGALPIANFTRLSELLGHQKFSKNAVEADLVRYVLQGHAKGLSQYYLELSIDAELTALCQRCLTPAPLVLNLKFNYLLGEIDAYAVEELDEVDVLAIEQAMDVIALVEDELIAALPIAPTHVDMCKLEHQQSGEKPNPFAVLKSLLK